MPSTTLAPHQPNEIPGEVLDAAEEERIASHAEHPGWACLPGRAIQVAKGAKSFRTPEPRFAAAGLLLSNHLWQFPILE